MPLTPATDFSPRLLRETAEVALTSVKRFIEEALAKQFQLRRVSAPLFIEESSRLCDSAWPGAKLLLPGDKTIEIVASLDLWLRDQLRRYDIAPGFGVYTIMNALRPAIPITSISSPHIAAWAWQQVLEKSDREEARLKAVARKIYNTLLDCEQMILDTFPHLTPTLQKNLIFLNEEEIGLTAGEDASEALNRHFPTMTSARSHGESTAPGAVILMRPTATGRRTAELWVWNPNLHIPLQLADISYFSPNAIAPASIGGNIYRDMLALQILQQNQLLGY